MRLLLAVFLLGSLSISCTSTERERQSVGQYVDSAAISTKVKTALIRSDKVRANDIEVTTYKSDVQLSGFVDSEQQKERAAELAKRVSGVQKVYNDIIVKGE